MYPGVHASERPSRTALAMSDGSRISYAELNDRSIRLVRLLAGADQASVVRPGATLAVVMENRVEWGEVTWAAMRSGRYVAPLNRHLKPAELAYQIGDSGADTVITSAGLVDTVTEALGEHLRPPRVLVAGGAEYERLLAEQSGGPLPDERLGARMLYSSGTTGRPKGMRQPLRDVHPADAPPRLGPLVTRLGVDADAVFASAAPNYHAAPFTFMLIVTSLGGTFVAMPRFDAAEMLATVERERVTHLQLVPTMLIRLLKLPTAERARYDLSSLRVAVTSGAPCPPSVHDGIRDWWGPLLHEYYGASEGYGQTHINPAEWREHRGSVGRAMKGTLHIADPDTGAELPAGEVGRVFFSGTDPVSYHNDAERSARTRNELGWSTIGDLGRLDEDGFLYLTGREGHTIISGGVNIYPTEIEDALTAHPAVDDVAVVGMPDEEFGESVRAVVVPAPGYVGTPELAAELVAHVRSRLATFKAPRQVDFVGALPRNSAGKLLKDQVRDGYRPAPTATQKETASHAH